MFWVQGDLAFAEPNMLLGRGSRFLLSSHHLPCQEVQSPTGPIVTPQTYQSRGLTEKVAKDTFEGVKYNSFRLDRVDGLRVELVRNSRNNPQRIEQLR